VENLFTANYWREMAEGMRIKAEIILDTDMKRIMLEIVECYEELAWHLEVADPHRKESDAQGTPRRTETG